MCVCVCVCVRARVRVRVRVSNHSNNSLCPNVRKYEGVLISP